MQRQAQGFNVSHRMVVANSYWQGSLLGGLQINLVFKDEYDLAKIGIEECWEDITNRGQNFKK